MTIALEYVFFFFKQKTAYEMRISDWSSDVCSSDLDDAIGETRRRAVHIDGVGELASRIGQIVADLEPTHRQLLHQRQGDAWIAVPQHADEIGRAPWRERACTYV